MSAGALVRPSLGSSAPSPSVDVCDALDAQADELEAQARATRTQATALEVQAHTTRALAAALRSGRVPSTSLAPLLTPHECAAALGISIATLNRRVIEGVIPFVQIGDARRYDLDAVRAALVAAPTTLLGARAPERETQPASGVRRVSAGGGRRSKR